MTNKNMKEKYMEYQILMQQLQQLQQNISALEKHIIDLRGLDDNLNSLSQTKINSETLMPLGSGIFLKGELKDNKTVIMNVGNNVCVEKNMVEARDTVNKQLEEVSIVLGQLQEEVDNTAVKLNEMQSELQSAKEEIE